MFDTVVRVAITTRRRRRREREEYEEAFVFLLFALLFLTTFLFSFRLHRKVLRGPRGRGAGTKKNEHPKQYQTSRGSILCESRQKIWSARNNDTLPTNHPPRFRIRKRRSNNVRVSSILKRSRTRIRIHHC